MRQTDSKHREVESVKVNGEWIDQKLNDLYGDLKELDRQYIKKQKEIRALKKQQQAL